MIRFFQMLRKLGMAYLAGILVFTTIFVLSFHIPGLTLSPVLFYRGFWLLIMVSGVMAFFFWLANTYWLKLSNETVFAIFIASVSLNTVFFVLFPVTFERSLTMYLLRRLSIEKKQAAPVNMKQLNNDLITIYVQKNAATKKRMREQSILGFVDYRVDKVAITERGRRFLDWATLISKWYKIGTVN